MDVYIPLKIKTCLKKFKRLTLTGRVGILKMANLVSSQRPWGQGSLNMPLLSFTANTHPSFSWIIGCLTL